jgi:drug/metabolite transporter (DMT)-like permease
MAFIFLKEAVTWKVIGGGALITLGTLLMIW